MAFTVLALEQLHQLMMAQFRNILPEHNSAILSDNWKRNRIPALAVTDAHAHISQVARDALADTAEGGFIDRHGNLYNVTRRAATTARGTDAGRIKGSVGATWTTADRLQHKSGVLYRALTSGTMTSAGQVDVTIISVSTGEEANLAKGEFLSWVTTPAGLEDEVELVVAVEGAEDQETAGEYQQRIVERIGEGAKGGAQADYVQWVRDATDASGDKMNIDEGYVWRHRNGFGSVDVAGLFNGTGANRLLTAQQRSDLLTYIQGLDPVTHQARVLEVVTQAQNIETTLVPISDGQFARDWDDATPLTVLSWTAATRLLKFTANRPSSMDIGDSVIVNGKTGEELVIESFGSNPDEVIIKEALYTPVATDTVYSGGPLVAPVRVAIQALINGLGPRYGDFGAGDFRGTLYTSELFEVIQTTSGVLDSNLITPASNVVPTEKVFPDDTQINLLTAGEILVRYA